MHPQQPKRSKDARDGHDLSSSYRPHHVSAVDVIGRSSQCHAKERTAACIYIYIITNDGLFVCGHPGYIGTIWENIGTIWENIGSINRYVGTNRKKCRNLKRLGCAERIALRFSLLSWHKHLQRCGHSYPRPRDH